MSPFLTVETMLEHVTIKKRKLITMKYILCIYHIKPKPSLPYLNVQDQ